MESRQAWITKSLKTGWFFGFGKITPMWFSVKIKLIIIVKIFFVGFIGFYWF
jgi:hypothetical protein